VRIALLLVVLVACERGGTCEQRLKTRLGNDPRWRDLLTSKKIEAWVHTCREIDSGKAVPVEARTMIDCVVDADTDDAAIKCVGRIVGPQ
jgi:hypothetical protein